MLLTRDAAVILGATFCYLASAMLANPLIAGFAGTLGAAAALMGVLTALMNACSLVVRPIAGNLSDRLPKRALAGAGAAPPGRAPGRAPAPPRGPARRGGSVAAGGLSGWRADGVAGRRGAGVVVVSCGWSLARLLRDCCGRLAGCGGS